jgi:HK97 family phage major capsid protein
MLEKLKKLLAAKEARRQEIDTKSDASTDLTELRSLTTEITAINAEILELRGMIETIEKEQKGGDPLADQQIESRAAALPGQGTILATFGSGSEMRSVVDDLMKQVEARAAQLMDGKAVIFTPEELQALEKRAVTLAGGTLLVPKHQSSTLNPSFNEISSVINQVNSISLPGGDTYSKGYEIGIGEGDYTTETGNYTESDPTFGYVDIVKAKITVYSEITDEVKKLPAVDYAAYVSSAVLNMLRKKISKEIFVGTGGANKLRGILTSTGNLTNDIDLATIDANSLTKIVFGYGGSEDVEGGATLYVNKLTLQQFAEVRGTDSKPVYKITMNGNTGTIGYADGSLTVPYTLSSVLTSFAATAEDAFFGVYGNAMAYELTMFSGVEILESRDFKFRTGQIAYRGSVFAGGSPAAFKGFSRLKKNAVA